VLPQDEICAMLSWQDSRNMSWCFFQDYKKSKHIITNDLNPKYLDPVSVDLTVISPFFSLSLSIFLENASVLVLWET
jgi:hypothetical protein